MNSIPPTSTSKAMSRPLKILISGASFAGLSTAYWMEKFGHEVTVVEIGPSLKRGGTPVDIRENAISVVERMGLYESIRSNRLWMEGVTYKNSDDVVIGRMKADQQDDNGSEIERDVLLGMIYGLVQPKVNFIFSDSIKSIEQKPHCVETTLHKGGTMAFDLILGCDGVHSGVRKAVFGEEANFTHFLKAYFAIAITEELLIEENTTEIYNEPGRAIMLNAYNKRTDLVFSFRSEKEIEYDYRNDEQQRDIVKQHYENVEWRGKELLERLLNAKDFYFDKFCQVKMPTWVSGRVALVGDAGYCASPAAGMGGSLAMIGAAALADAFDEADGNFETAFKIYEERLRPYVESIQERAVEFAKDVFLPRTQQELDARNSRLSGN